MKEEQYLVKINELQKILDDKTNSIKDLQDKYEKIEKELNNVFKLKFRETIVK